MFYWTHIYNITIVCGLWDTYVPPSCQFGSTQQKKINHRQCCAVCNSNKFLLEHYNKFQLELECSKCVPMKLTNKIQIQYHTNKFHWSIPVIILRSTIFVNEMWHSRTKFISRNALKLKRYHTTFVVYRHYIISYIIIYIIIYINFFMSASYKLSAAAFRKVSKIRYYVIYLFIYCNIKICNFV